jgi:secreted Zn-dependent insulinase-like peptidase
MQGVQQHREKWFDMPFITAEVPVHLIDQWCTTEPCAQLQLPPKNRFIAEDFAMLQAPAASPATNGASPAQGVTIHVRWTPQRHHVPTDSSR